MSKEENLRAGIAAAKAGDRARAAALFAQVVKEDPHSEQGWYLLGFCSIAPERREYCFRRVLALNPDHAEAKKQLERLSRPAPASVPPFYTSPTSHADRSKAEKTAPPFATAPIEHEEKRLITTETPSTPAPAAIDPVPKRKRTPAKQKLSKKMLILAFLGIPIVIACGLGTIFILFSSQISQLLSPGSNIQAPTFPAQWGTNTPAPTSTLGPPTMLPTPRPTVPYTPLFEDTPCAFDVHDYVDVRCGYVTVPEDRSGDPSHTIRLAVAVYKSFAENPAPDPVIFLQGGPGAEAVQLSADAYDVLVEPFLSKRDFVTFDQRGTGLSEPSLGCEELTKTYSQDIHGLIDKSTRELVYSTSFYSCQGLMSAKGINLNAYSTVESAADVRDILSLLGYQKANLYGASYGTRLAQVVMREYPELVSSAILDSVVPMDTSLFSNYPNAIQSGLRTLFINCAIDPQCSAAYPNLETVFWDLVNELDTNPVTVTTSGYPNGTLTETVTGTTILNVILGSIKNSYFISTAPQSIYRFKNGDFSTLILQQSGLPFTFEGISPGLFITMMCREHVLTTTPAEVQSVANRQIIKEFAWLPFYGDTDNVFETCKNWGASGPEFGENDPVVSDIPSLVISGAYDPTTPPIYAKQITEGLSRSYYFEFPHEGHTPTASDSSGCAMKVVDQFLADPSVEPDRTCLDETKPVAFVVPYTGNPPLALKTIQTSGLSVDVPKEWQFLGEGFYYRGNSPFDITEAGLLMIPGSPQDIEDWFSLKAYGYRGLDSPLIPAGQRQSNGLAWQLYKSSSYGRPVDIAMAEDRGWSIVVLLFCNPDEHDALYQTVFIPMVDSVDS
jgi:pimeloyl-ACP methyl ester carboxylesterase